MTLILRKAETGVERSSLDDPPCELSSGRAVHRDEGVKAPTGTDPATLGVNGLLLGGFAAALRTGIRGEKQSAYRREACWHFHSSQSMETWAARASWHGRPRMAMDVVVGIGVGEDASGGEILEGCFPKMSMRL